MLCHRVIILPMSCFSDMEPRTAVQAELESELSELQQLPGTKEVKARLAEVRQELRQFRPPGPWWKVW
jgi:hypothetical protein